MKTHYYEIVIVNKPIPQKNHTLKYNKLIPLVSCSITIGTKDDLKKLIMDNSIKSDLAYIAKTFNGKFIKEIAFNEEMGKFKVKDIRDLEAKSFSTFEVIVLTKRNIFLLNKPTNKIEKIK